MLNQQKTKLMNWNEMKVHAQNEIIKLFIEPCHVCGKVCKNITLANYYQLCIDYESNMHILKVLKKKIEALVTPVAIESL